MKSALLVIAQEVFRDEEYSEPKAALEAASVEVTTASAHPGTAIGKLGLRASVDISLTDASERTWDCVAFIGGAGAQTFFDDKSAHKLAQDTLDAGGLIGAICIAPSILARAGVLMGVKATSFPTQRDDLVAHGAQWSDDPVVEDGRIVTANGPEAASAFGERLVAAIQAHSR